MATQDSSPEQKLLKHLFAQMSMTDLPAMSSHVQELISLTNNNRSTANDLTEVILRDFSLTNKILQVANSAYYSRGVPINSVRRAITVIGFTVVRQLAMAIALFEELIDTAQMKEHLTTLLAKAFLSAMVAKLHAEKTNLHIKPDEVFLCSMLYNLGEIIVVVYLPELYQKIAVRVKNGQTLETATKETLCSLSFMQIGKEIIRLWNFSKQLHNCLTAVPPRPQNDEDNEAVLINLVVFSNHFVSLLCAAKKPHTLVSNFGKIIKIDLKKSISLFSEAIEVASDISDVSRKGFLIMNMQKLLTRANKFVKT